MRNMGSTDSVAWHIGRNFLFLICLLFTFLSNRLTLTSQSQHKAAKITSEAKHGLLHWKKNMFTGTQAHRPSDLLKLCEEVVDHVFDLRGLRREQDELFIGQVELEHVLGRDRHEEDVRVAAQEVIRRKRKGPEVKSPHRLADLALCFMREWALQEQDHIHLYFIGVFLPLISPVRPEHPEVVWSSGAASHHLQQFNAFVRHRQHLHSSSHAALKQTHTCTAAQ